MIEFVELVRQMRMAQNDYFSAVRQRRPQSNTNQLIAKAKKLERQVDIEVENMTEEPDVRFWREKLVSIIRNHEPNPKKGVEVGVWQGRTSEFLLSAFPDLYMRLVDPWCTSPSYQRSGDPLAKTSVMQFEQHKQTAITRMKKYDHRSMIIQDTSENAASFVKDDSQDFVFIDGNHLEYAVLEDCRRWWKKVQSGGLIIGHDYGNEGGEWTKGVKPAWDKFAKELSCDVFCNDVYLCWIKKCDENSHTIVDNPEQ